MSHVHDQPSDGSAHGVCRTSQPLDAPEVTQPPNVVTGVVCSRTEGLTRTTYRIRISDRIDVRVRWPHSSRRALEIGRPVRLMIPQETVHLEAGGFRRGKQRWNRWIGRVVLAATQNQNGSITVKIHHAPITLKSRGPVIGARTPLTTWDTVNIVVDPQHINVCDCAPATPQPQPVRAGLTGASVSQWLRATICSVRSLSTETYLTVRAGRATFCLLIEAESSTAAVLVIGHSIEFAIDNGDAWVRRTAAGPILPCCIVLMNDFDDAQRASFALRKDRTSAVS